MTSKRSSPHPLKLTQAGEFRAVLAAQYRSTGKGFSIRAATNSQSGARLGLIASRKAARRAVDRNRAKRIAREAFRAVRPGLPALDVVLQLRLDLRNRDNSSIREELDRLLRDAAARFGREESQQPTGAEGAAVS